MQHAGGGGVVAMPTNLSINIGHLAAQHHTADFALHLQALERSPLGLGELHGLGDHPLLFQVHLTHTDTVVKDVQIHCTLKFVGPSDCVAASAHLHVGVLLGRQVEDPPGVVVETPDDVPQGEASVADGGEQQRQHGFQAGVAGRRLLGVLLLQRVRRCGHHHDKQ